MWDVGQTIVHQEVWNDRVWAARPLTVVEDTDERLLLWIPKGTLRKVPATPPTRTDPSTREARAIENLHRSDWIFTDHVWDVSSLWILSPGEWHALWVSWSEPEVHLGWYVNLQRPFRRTALGIESMDLMLDVVVEPDLTWRWKDKEEFEEIVERGIFDEALGRRIRDEADAVIESIESERSVFSESWPSWRPDPTWELPVLSSGWNTPATTLTP